MSYLLKQEIESVQILKTDAETNANKSLKNIT